MRRKRKRRRGRRKVKIKTLSSDTSEHSGVWIMNYSETKTTSSSDYLYFKIFTLIIISLLLSSTISCFAKENNAKLFSKQGGQIRAIKNNENNENNLNHESAPNFDNFFNSSGK